MKAILLAILLCKPLLGYCQLDEGDLKELFSRQYLEHLPSHCAYTKGLMIFSNMQELFKGYFNDSRIYLAFFSAYDKPEHWVSHTRDLYPVIYATDTKTGKLLVFKTSAQFYSFINGTSKKITILDKAYLYHFLYLKILEDCYFIIQDPLDRPSDMWNNSVFTANNNNIRDIFSYPGMNGHIYPYVLWHNGKIAIHCGNTLSEFIFDAADNMTNVVIDTLH